jgi:O-antigen/teichoic acid export membrane protein
MTRNSDLRLIGVNAEVTRETLRGGCAPALRAAPIKAISAEDRGRRPLERASIAAFAVLVFGAGLSYLAQLVTARVIGLDSYGVYAYVLAWVTLLGYSSTLGFHVSLLRFVPAYQARQEWGLVRGVIQYSERGAAGAAAGIVLISVCGIAALHGSMQPELAYTFLLGIAAVPLITLHLIGASVVRAFGGVVAALAPERVVRDSLLLAIIAIAFWCNLHRLDATLAMGATLVSSLVVLGLVRIFLRRMRPPSLDQAKPAYAAGDWWQPTLPLTVIMAADNLMSRSGVIALGLAGNTRDAGIFAIALSMAMLTALPRMALAAAFAPTVSTLFARGDQAGLQSLSAKAACLSLLGTTCTAIPLVLLAQPFLSWFGRDFAAGAPLVTILVLGHVFASACGPQQHLITMTGHERIGAALLAMCAGSSFIACMLIIGLLGMTGVALAMTAALIVWNVAMGVFIHKRLHLMPGLLASLKAIPRRRRAADCEI